MKTAAVLFLAIAFQALGNVFLSLGMKAVKAAGSTGIVHLVLIALQAAGSPAIWLGTIFSITFFLLYSAALSWADLSFVLPATSFGYVLNIACGHYFLHESVHPARWAGSLVIVFGVLLVSRTGQSTTPGVEPALETAGGLR